MKYFSLLFFLFIFFIWNIFPNKNEEYQVSLLTVMPSNEAIYTIYGHSALRIYSSNHNTDIVYNWGTFDFNSPYFLFHFLKGDSNYFLSSCNYNTFQRICSLSHKIVTHQILSISPEGEKMLLREIYKNMKHENRKYHYNVFKDNCTTRIRNLLEKTINRSLVDSTRFDAKTFRQWIHTYTGPYRWISFGIDLIIGSEADRPINYREALFLPKNLKETVSHFKYDAGSPLVISSFNTVNTVQSKNNKMNCSLSIISPSKLGWILFYFYGSLLIVVGFFYYKKKITFFKVFYFIINNFAFLFFIYALFGCCILYIVIFSSLPCTSSNWNLLWLHPFHLIAFIDLFITKKLSWIVIYHLGNILLLILFLTKKVELSQYLNSEIIPYVFCLITASLFCLIKRKIWKLYENNG